MNATIATIRKLVEKHGGAIERDGMGGYDILASPPGEEPMRRWIDAEVWCQPLPLGELDREERLERIEEVICMIEGGTEPYPEPNPQQERTGPMNATKSRQVYLAAETDPDGFTQVWGPFSEDRIGQTDLRVVTRSQFVPFSDENRPVPNGAGGTVQGTFVRLV